MGIIKNRTIVAGICGGIAAYKAAGVVSQLRQQGADVHVIMTHAAAQFVTPLTFESLSHNRVLVDLFSDKPLAHVELAHRADLFVVMPATYNIIGQIAQGLAPDYLTTTIAATTAPVLLVPAMESQMYENPVFQKNMQVLQSLGHRILEPEAGALASGRSGIGRFPDEGKILGEIEQILADRARLAGKRVLITAGPTREKIDPMRVITNRSSGKMGYAMAEAARNMGAQVTLISGPTQIPEPASVERIDVESAEEMRDAVLQRAQDHDIVIMAAAVADWRPAKASEIKESKLAGDTLSIEMERTPDILTELGASLNGSDQRPIIVGFAAETGDMIEKARGKLERKNLDWIVANDLSQPGAGAEIETNIATLINKSGKALQFEKMSKRELARKILLEIVTS